VMMSTSDGPLYTAQDTHLAKGEYAAFFENNKGGIQYVNIETRTYYIQRGWAVRGPIPRGAKVEMTGLANQRRAGKSKRRRG